MNAIAATILINSGIPQPIIETVVPGDDALEFNNEDNSQYIGLF